MITEVFLRKFVQRIPSVHPELKEVSATVRHLLLLCEFTSGTESYVALDCDCVNVVLKIHETERNLIRKTAQCLANFLLPKIVKVQHEVHLSLSNLFF